MIKIKTNMRHLKLNNLTKRGIFWPCPKKFACLIFFFSQCSQIGTRARSTPGSTTGALQGPIIKIYEGFLYRITKKKMNI